MIDQSFESKAFSSVYVFTNLLRNMLIWSMLGISGPLTLSAERGS